MAKRLVSVDDNNALPAPVQAALVGQVRSEFTALTTQAQAAASASAQSAAEAAVSRSYVQPTRDMVEDVVDEVLPSALTAALPAATASAVQDVTVARLGTRAARMAATSVPRGAIYAATDVQELYFSTGTAWQVIGSGGNELGRAQTTAMFSTTAGSPVYVPGLTVTWVAGDRPVEFRFAGDIANGVANNESTLWFNLDGATGYIGNLRHTFSHPDRWLSMYRAIRCPVVLTPGTTHTIRIGVTAQSGSTARVGGDGNNPTSLQVVTL